MTRILAALGLLVFLASCGADGEPTPPPQSSVTISGTARVGVVAKL